MPVLNHDSMKQLTTLTCAGLAALLFTPPATAQSVLADDAGPHHLGGDDGVITPDGRWGLVRENSLATSARFYDMATGAHVLSVPSTGGAWSGVCQDAVVATDSRAALIGSTLMIFDMTLLPGNPLLAEHPVGVRPRDLEITPDESMLVVRGGHEWQGAGGLSIYDLNTGALLVTSPGEPQIYPSNRHSFDVDSVATSDEHAVFTSVVYLENKAFTMVTIFELRPAGGGPPQLVYETRRDNGSHQPGGPHDVAMTPDGQFCAVRSELGVALYGLAGPNSRQMWQRRLMGQPGPFGDAALDSIEVTNDRIATISRQSNPSYPIGAQVDVFDIAGSQAFDRVLGDPHDLALDAGGDNLIVRTHTQLLHYELSTWSPGNRLVPKSLAVTLTGSHASYGAGLDSVVIHDTRVASLVRDFQTTQVYVHDFGSGALTEIGNHTMPDKPIDLAITPSGERLVVSGTASVDVVDMNTGAGLLTHQVFSSGWWPWCDGVVVDDTRALAFGIGTPNASGWVSIVDLFGEPTNYCATNPNSTGNAGHIYAVGSASVTANDLELWASNLPAPQWTQFFYGPLAQQVPLASGFLCVGGNIDRFPLQVSGAGGIAVQPVDFGNLPGGAISAGSTWRFQVIHRDILGGSLTANLTDGLEILFGN